MGHKGVTPVCRRAMGAQQQYMLSRFRVAPLPTLRPILMRHVLIFEVDHPVHDDVAEEERERAASAAPGVKRRALITPSDHETPLRGYEFVAR